jgi:2-keto-4-pentenoate hydratase/2-oxohepta-3-ene-1,7-dioic acid hydratase in catechol pathway
MKRIAQSRFEEMQMKIIRKLYDKNQYYIRIGKDGGFEGVSQSLKMLFKTGGINSKKLMDKIDKNSQLEIPCSPTKIVCVGLNYKLHAAESKKEIPQTPLLFLKPLSAIIPSGGEIILPKVSQNVHYEGELAVIIKKRAKNVKIEEADEYILGYTIMNDVTARDIQRKEKTYTRSKCFDTFAPIGPAMVTDLKPDELTVETRVNGELKQNSSCSDMIFKIPRLIEFITSIMTLEPGDIISTGTPSGVGPLKDGDMVEIKIKEIGILKNSVSIEE